MARWNRKYSRPTPQEKDQKELNSIGSDLSSQRYMLRLVDDRHENWVNEVVKRKQTYAQLQQEYGKEAIWKQISPRHIRIRHKQQELLTGFPELPPSGAERRYILGEISTYEKTDIDPAYSQRLSEILSLTDKLTLVQNRIDRRKRRIEEEPALIEKKRQEELIKEKKKKREHELLRAKADAYDGETRRQQQTIKRRLKSQLKKHPYCPYCHAQLSFENCHLDHIYPVSKGGKSTAENSVLVCTSCNQAKSNHTLRNFCKRAGLDYPSIARSLEALGKDI